MESLQDLLTEEIRDLYDAEKQLVKELPKLAKAASNEELRDAFNEHLEITKGQVTRLEQVFELLDQRPKGKPCKAMKGLIEEGHEILEEDAEESLLDCAIIGAAQKVEHYEISGYGTARTLAKAIGMKDAAELLDETLKEEGEADKKLTQISLRIIKESQRGDGAAHKEEPSGGGRSGARKNASQGHNGGRSAQKHNESGSAKGESEHTKVTVDHEEIRQWAEERGAEPACVRGTKKGNTCLLRLDFPGYTGEESLEHISWDEFFKIFDESDLALLYQDETASGKKSNFNKLVSRESVDVPKASGRKHR
jgi:ferritin-like metal-binding protein YciE